MMDGVGIYDRDYYREQPRGGFGVFAMWSVTTWLIALNVVVFFADHLITGAQQRRAMQQIERDVLVLDQAEYERHEEEFDRRYMHLLAARGPISAAGYFSVEMAIYHAQIWRLITFQFLHASPMH